MPDTWIMSEPCDVHPEMSVLIAAKAQTAGGDRGDWLRYAAATSREHPPDMTVEDRELSVSAEGSARRIPVRIYRPGGAPSPSAGIVFLHGGGFVKGDLDTSDTVAWGVAEGVGAVVISVAYRLAPEHPFPAAPEDCHAALGYVAAHPGEFGVDAHRIALWGDSAGGNLAAACALMARDRGGPPIRALAINYPCLTDELTSSSYVRYADSAGLTTAATAEFWGHYLGDRIPTADAYACPVKARDLGGLPPTHVHVAEIDPLADDGIEFAAKLRDAGVAVTLRIAERMIHGFIRARFLGPDSAAEFEAPCTFLREHLKTG